MLYTVFSFRGNELKSNRVPESYKQLLEAANTIKLQHDYLQDGVSHFNITFITQTNTTERPIINDHSLMAALNEVYENKSNEKNHLVIKFLIYEKPRIPMLAAIRSMEPVRVNRDSITKQVACLRNSNSLPAKSKDEQANASHVDEDKAIDMFGGGADDREEAEDRQIESSSQQSYSFS